MDATNEFAAVQRVNSGELTTRLIRPATTNARAPDDLGLRLNGHGFMREDQLQIELSAMGQALVDGKPDSASAHILGCTNHFPHPRADHAILNLNE